MLPDNPTRDQIEAVFANDRFATQAAGCRVVEGERGRAVCEMELADIHKNAMGNVMGGAIFTLADFALAVSCNIGEEPTVSVDSNISFLRATKGAKLSGVSAQLNIAEAYASMKSAAWVGGSAGTIRVSGKLAVNSEAYSYAAAVANKPFSASLAELAALKATAFTNDTITAGLGAADGGTSGVTIEAGDISVTARGDTVSRTTSASSCPGRGSASAPAMAA